MCLPVTTDTLEWQPLSLTGPYQDCPSNPLLHFIVTPPPIQTQALNTPLNPKRTLTVCEITNKEEWPLIAKIAKQWKTVAHQKEMDTIKLTGSAWANKFSASESVAQNIKTDLQDLKRFQGRVFVCRDVAQQEVHGIAICQGIMNYPNLFLDHLATNPINIREPVNAHEAARVEGAGTAIMAHLASVCLKENKHTFALAANMFSTSFYEKLGFERHINKNFHRFYIYPKDKLSELASKGAPL